MKTYNIDNNGFYGDFGGAFIPEMLYPNVIELKENYNKLTNEPQFQKEFEVMVKSKKRHRLNLEQYIDTGIVIKSNNVIIDQLKKLSDLYKSGVLTKNEFEKAKKKILN